jgi:hypothetical protein
VCDKRGISSLCCSCALSACLLGRGSVYKILINDQAYTVYYQEKNVTYYDALTGTGWLQKQARKKDVNYPTVISVYMHAD